MGKSKYLTILSNFQAGIRIGAYKILIPLKYKGFQGRNCEKITIKGRNRNKTVTFWFIIKLRTAKDGGRNSKGKGKKSIEVLL